VQKHFQHAEACIRNARFRDSSIQVVGGRLVGFPPNEPACTGSEDLCHRSLMLSLLRLVVHQMYLYQYNCINVLRRRTSYGTGH
jgi:hypothetical protein